MRAVKKIHFDCYRKLKNIDIDFTSGINIISGTNGTCKSSILHIISNSFQAVKADVTDSNLKQCIDTIKTINDQFNPKLESLTRGDKKYKDPAPGHQGSYYSVDYYDNQLSLSFRKHNSKKPPSEKRIQSEYRYAVKPQYKKGTRESLPSRPIIYLGLNRLVTYGEFRDTEPIKAIRKNIPAVYLTELSNIYKSFTGYEISNVTNEHMGSVKIRADFISSTQGIDSNTISAGEDNLYIILLALESLKYYYETLPEDKRSTVSSILLIDEFDATLHPAFQFKLFDIVSEFSTKYKIQAIFTSHSLTLLEYCLKNKQNLIYLYDNLTRVHLIENPSMYKIEMYLKSKTKKEYSFEKKIAVFSEDNEARFLLNILFDYFCESDDYCTFKNIRSFLYIVDIKAGSEVLHTLFKDYKLRSFVGQICILDGDHSNEMNNQIIALPGNKAPEQFLIEYAQTLYEKDDDKFWLSDVILDQNVGKPFYSQTFKPAVDAIENKINDLKKQDKSTSGVRREENKKLFNNNIAFFQILFEEWLRDPNNKAQIQRFYDNLKKLFKKVAPINGIDSDLWE